MFRIKGASVQNFKSIVNTNSVEFHDNITAIVGKTGTGKTSLLKLLASIRQNVTYQEAELPNGSDIKNKFTNGNIKSDKILMLKTKFEFEPNSSEIMKELFGEADSIEVSKFFDGHYEISCDTTKMVEGTQDLSNLLNDFRNIIEDIKVSFQNAQSRINITNFRDQTFRSLDSFLTTNLRNISEVDLAIQTLQNQLNTVPKDPQFQNELSIQQKNLKAVRDELHGLIQDDPVKKVIASLPHIRYIADFYELEEKISVDTFIQKPTASKTFYYLSVLSGLSPSGVSRVREMLPQERKSYFDAMSDKLTVKVNEFFNTGYNFRIDMQGQDLLLFVQSVQNKNTISISEMSEGQKWWVAFYLYLATMNSRNQNYIILLDNPATSLHDEGKGEVLRFINKMSQSEKIQFIYATHEKALIDPWRLDRVILVRKDKDGTKLENVRGEGRADLLETIRKHVGSPAKYSLFGAPRNLFFEGVSDVYFMSAFNEFFEGNGDDFLNKDIYSVNAVNGIDQTVHFWNLLKDLGLDYLFVVDSGSDKISKIKTKVGEEEFTKHFIEIKEVISREGDIEDLFSHETYYDLFELAYRPIIRDFPSFGEIFVKNSGSKMINFFKDYFSKLGNDFDKVLVSYQTFRLIEMQELTSKEAFQNSKSNFKKLIEIIEKRFKSIQ